VTVNPSWAVDPPAEFMFDCTLLNIPSEKIKLGIDTINFDEKFYLTF
jgi:hypothetical protein